MDKQGNDVVGTGDSMTGPLKRVRAHMAEGSQQ